MHIVESKDDVLTVLCHLGYLTYDRYTQSVRIPNYEVHQEFEASLKDTGWSEVMRAVENSENKRSKKHECRIEKIQGVDSKNSRSKTKISRSKAQDSRSKKIHEIIEFCALSPHTLEEIAVKVGSKDKYYMKKVLLDPILGTELFMTEPESPNSPTQKYYC